MIQSYRKRLFYLTPLLIFLIAALPASGANDTSAAGAALLSINGTAFLDENSDTVFSSGEPGLSGVIIRLMQGDVEIAYAVTGKSGEYAFSNLTPGDYTVSAESAGAAGLTVPASGRYDLTLASLPAYYIDFGFNAPRNATHPFRRYPIMRPTAEMATAWSMQFNASHKAFLSPEISAKLAAAPPASYSLLDQLNYTPSERDQGTCGNCWAWAGTAVMEIDYARQRGTSERFSVQFLNSNFNGGCGSSGACCGGWLSDVADFYGEKGIIVPWRNENALYQDKGTECGSCSAVSPSDISTSPSYAIDSISDVSIPTHGIPQEEAIENIKNVLLQGKAVWFAFFLPDSSSWDSVFSFWGSRPESAVWRPDASCGRSYNPAQGGGHAVLCVGYNDTDPKNRYWVMLNSWGDTTSRPAGLFRVNMNMNYNCAYLGLGSAFYWMTLDMSYPEEEGDSSLRGTPLIYSASVNGSDGSPVNTSGQEITTTHSRQKAGSGESSSLSSAKRMGIYAAAQDKADRDSERDSTGRVHKTEKKSCDCQQD